MTTFWILALGLCLLAAAFIILPAYLSHGPAYLSQGEDPGSERLDLNVTIYEERLDEYQELFDQGDMIQEEFDQLVTELKKNLLSETASQSEQAEVALGFNRLPLLLAVLVPLFAVLAYSDLGLSWGSIDDLLVSQALRGNDPEDVENMYASVEKLAELLENQPDNVEGWFLLAQSYLNLQAYEKSAVAFKHLVGKYPRDGSLASYYAEAVFMADDREMTERSEQAVDRTLALNPNDITMLEIKAMAAFQTGDLQGSLKYFGRALSAGPEEERAKMIRGAMARIEAGLQAQDRAPDLTEEGSSQGRQIQVLVEVADTVDVEPETAVFVFARAVGGPPVPLAVDRLLRGSLPKLVTMDESKALMAGKGLSDFDQVQIVARISLSGVAEISEDDYQALSQTIDLTQGNAVVKLKIEKRVKDH